MARKQTGTPRKCYTCGKSYYRKPSQAGRFCSQRCFLNALATESIDALPGGATCPDCLLWERRLTTLEQELVPLRQAALEWEAWKAWEAPLYDASDAANSFAAQLPQALDAYRRAHPA